MEDPPDGGKVGLPGWTNYGHDEIQRRLVTGRRRERGQRAVAEDPRPKGKRRRRFGGLDASVFMSGFVVTDRSKVSRFYAKLLHHVCSIVSIVAIVGNP
jgi:hypothetical protein